MIVNPCDLSISDRIVNSTSISSFLSDNILCKCKIYNVYTKLLTLFKRIAPNLSAISGINLNFSCNYTAAPYVLYATGTLCAEKSKL